MGAILVTELSYAKEKIILRREETKEVCNIGARSILRKYQALIWVLELGMGWNLDSKSF